MDGVPEAIKKALPLDTILYTDFDKVKKLEKRQAKGDASDQYKTYDITYGVDDQRITSTYSINFATQVRTTYLGDFEEEYDAVKKTYKKTHYLHGAILIQNYAADGTTLTSEQFYSTISDFQGSLIALVDEQGAVAERYAFDPWGARRNPDDWTQTDARTSWITHRGYTGHEHIDVFGVIDMNGRVYDPMTAIFFSPDPFVQSAGDWMNYNRYTYCMNNPFRYTDPSGEFWHLIIGAIIGGTINWIANGAEFSWKGLGYFGIGAAAGALGAGVGAGISSAIAGGTFGAGFVGSSAAMTASTSFISGAAIGGGAGFSSGFVTGLGNGLMQNQSFGDALWSGTVAGLIGGVSGALLGGILGGIDAVNHDRGFFTGKPNELVDQVDFGYELRPQDPNSNDCFVKSAESYEAKSGNGRSADEIRKVIGKEGSDKHVYTSDMEKAGYDFNPKSNQDQAFNYMKKGKSAFHLENNGNDTGHATLVNKMQKWISGDTGKVFYKLYTMNPSASQYTLTRINVFLFINSLIP